MLFFVVTAGVSGCGVQSNESAEGDTVFAATEVGTPELTRFDMQPKTLKGFLGT